MKQLYSKARGFIVGAKSIESFKKNFQMAEKNRNRQASNSQILVTEGPKQVGR